MSTARLMAIAGAALRVWVCALIALPTAAHAEPLGATFTYQGQLKKDGVKGNPPPLAVNGGLLCVELGFGSDVFVGDARWLQIAPFMSARQSCGRSL